MEARPRGEAVKRILDFSVAGLALLCLFPLWGIVAALIYFEDGRPIFFRQVRIGRYGKPFTILKFRSMNMNNLPPNEMGRVTGEHALVTRVGRYLRRFRIDEIPQLYAVLKGHMSLVGPRPTLPEQVEKYNKQERSRLLMPPGITGWAQVNGNTVLSWSERIQLDLWYVDNWSFWLDIVILVKTLGVIIFGEHRNSKAVEESFRHADRPRRSG